MTFLPARRTLPLVVYGSFRTLVNLLMVLVLGAVFLWGTFRVFGALGGSAAAPAPPTATPIVERPPTPVPPTPTKRPSVSAGAKATPTPRPTPRPSPTPNVPPKVYVALSATDPKGATSFSASAVQTIGGFPAIYCIVRNKALPQQGSVTFTDYQDVPNALPLYQRAIERYAGDTTYFYFQNNLFRIPGGKFRCEVAVNGVTIDVAHFKITP